MAARTPCDSAFWRLDLGQVYVLEVNPRASRTVPFVSKATGLPLARYASLIMVDKTLEELFKKMGKP